MSARFLVACGMDKEPDTEQRGRVKRDSAVTQPTGYRAVPGQKYRFACGQGGPHPGSGGQAGLPLPLEHKGPVAPLSQASQGAPTWDQRAGLFLPLLLKGSSRRPGAVQECPPSSKLS